MSIQRRIACAFALAAVVLSPTPSAADDSALNKEGFWTVGRGDADSESCFASVPTKAGATFMLRAQQGEVTFAVGAPKPMRRGRKGVFATDAWRFNFEPSYTDEGDVLFPGEYLSAKAMAALRLARAVAVVVDGRTVLDATLEGSGFEEALDAVIDCSYGDKGWWGPGVASADDGAKAAAQKGGTGTGFFISADGVAVTAAHVVKDCGRLESPRWGAVKVLAADPRADLAILKTSGASGQFVPLRPRGPKLGEGLSAAGYPLGPLLGSGLKITTGVVAGLAGPEGDRGLFQISAPIQPGNSGGPVIDAGGALIGVTSSKLDEIKLASATGTFPQNVNFAVPVTILQSFLEENGVAYRTAAPTAGAGAAAALTGYTFALVCTP